jgi:hypothetical protein
MPFNPVSDNVRQMQDAMQGRMTSNIPKEKSLRSSLKSFEMGLIV